MSPPRDQGQGADKTSGESRSTTKQEKFAYGLDSMVQRFIIETRFLNPRVGDNPTKTSCNTGGSPHEIERQHFNL
jgi:hypothetical protein